MILQILLEIWMNFAKKEREKCSRRFWVYDFYNNKE